mmetsp:Transcript_16042/g.27586  ORF Transcript_16042/g.27586 Transcript_16042/m.27586 type:complete len:273 (-) Transcript_16042:251-1069(-)
MQQAALLLRPCASGLTKVHGCLRWLSGSAAPPVSQSITELSQASQLSSSSSSQPAIYVACVLERLPVLAPETPLWESEYHAKQQQYLMQQGFLKDYPDVRHIYRPGTAQEASASQQSKTSAVHESQTSAQQSSLTEADRSGDTKSMARALRQRLYLVVKQPLQGSRAAWHFPHTQHQPDETIRQTCERALISTIGQQYPVFFIGNAPMAWTPLSGGDKLYYMLAQVVDDPWGALRLPEASSATDYQWLTSQEAAQHMADARMQDLLPRMLSL